MEPTYRSSVLRQAIAFGEKAPDMNRSELLSHYQKLSRWLKIGDPEQTKELLDLCVKVNALLPDTAPNKADLIAKITLLKNLVANHERPTANEKQ